MGACVRRKARRAAEADRDRRRDEAEIQRLLSLADRHFDLKNWDKAQDYYVQVLYLDKNHQHAKTRAEICETEDANERQAEKEAARAKEKSDSELRKLQTENAERLKRRERAMPLYDRARRAMDAAARMRIDEGGRYTVSQVLDKYREAREALTQARSEDDSYTEAWYFRGEVRHKMGQYELAELDFQEALKKDPDFAPAAFGSLMNQLSLYMMHAHTPYVQDAKARADAQARLVESPAAQTARRSRDNFERLCAQAVELFQQRNFTAAADRVGASGTEGTGNFFRHFILACVHLEGDKPTEALKELHASLELDPVSLEALFLDALVKYRRGDLEGARRSAEKAMEGSPQENWNVYLLRASIYEKLEMKDEAVKDIEKAAEINKDLAPLIRRKVDVVRKGT
jgi:tetratricopeptide (TPR) repeat protein